MFEDYYKFLGIHPGSNEQMIQDAYHLKRQKLELNIVKNSEEIELLEKIFKTLMDIPSRVEYDELWLKYKDRKLKIISNDEPTINYLRVNKTSFEVNDTIIVSWETSNCEIVYLSLCGYVEAEGEYTFTIEENCPFYIEIELYGKNSGYSKVSKTVRLNKGSTDFSATSPENKFNSSKEVNQQKKTVNKNRKNLFSNFYTFVRGLFLFR